MKTNVKRWNSMLSLLLFMALCASVTYWTLQWKKPKQRAVAAAMVTQPMIDPSMAATLFGGDQQAVAIASNYQLMGVVASKNGAGSAAIVSVDGKPAQALRVGSDVQAGVKISEVHAAYIVLSVGGVNQRVLLPEKNTNQPASPMQQGQGQQQIQQQMQIQQQKIQQQQIQQQMHQQGQQSNSYVPPQQQPQMMQQGVEHNN